MIPIAFAVETVRVEPQGWGMACVLAALWAGRFLGLLAYKRVGFRFHAFAIMIAAALVMCLAQAGLFVWISLSANSILAMSVSAFVYGLAAAFYFPSMFVAIPMVTTKSNRTQANSVLSVIGDVYAIIGPLLGVSLVLVFGFNLVLVFDAVTLLLAMSLVSILYASHRTVVSEGAEKPDNDKAMINAAGTDALPSWTYLGFLSWFFCAVAIGLVGAAGPTMIMAHHSATAWALVATAMAVGSLIGSAASLMGLAQRVSWPLLHGACGAGLAVQLFVVSTPVTVWAVCLAGFVGAATVTASGIRWDTLGQSCFTGKRLHSFASYDQFANTAGIPIGIILFGLSGVLDIRALAIAGVGCLAFIFVIPVLVGFVRENGLHEPAHPPPLVPEPQP
ncbi:MFS transporter [Tateyamaria sp. SN3-11]|uniref:MFS transporter n=1 Tax=Tateyamaria sp. SN3-11 TaxID=3092147 RepID=UPI0039E7F84F